MKKVTFSVYYCGISEELFAPNIRIYKPHDSICRQYVFENEIGADWKISDLIQKFLTDVRDIDTWTAENIQPSRIYVQTSSALYGFLEDKKIAEVFSDFETENLQLAFFCVGGASFESNGYHFIVHPSEEIHKNLPHVHVRRNENITRYDLNTLKRFPKDKFCWDFQRDEKKIILPYLKRNKRKLLGYWNMYMKGYTPPIEDEDGQQYYPES